MSLRYLRRLLAVTEELHYANEAERLHIEQSPLPRIIKQLGKSLTLSGTTDPDPKSCAIQKQNSGMIMTLPRAEVVPMKKSRFTEEQIVFALKQAELGTSVPEVCRKLGISDATFYTWRKKYGGISHSELKHMRQLEEENLRLKKLVADLSLDKAMLQVVLAKKT